MLAITTLPDPFFSGTLAGDMILNSSAGLNPGNLYSVALHEAGHALGLPDSSDPDSVMYPHDNPQAVLTSVDISDIQALYGARAPDTNEPNDSFATATTISYPLLYVGATPLVAYGDRTTASDTDFFSVTPPLLYTGPVTVELQTSGISFLEPQLTVYDQNHKVLGHAQSTSVFGDVVTIHLPSVRLGQRYYIAIDSPAQGDSGIGRYALSVTFDGRSTVDPASLPAILRGPYDSLRAGDIAGLLTGVVGLLFQTDLHTNDSFLTAQPLESRPGYPTDTRYDIVASLSDTFDTDVYRVTAPQAPVGQADILTASLTEMPINGVLPIVSIYDANANPVSDEILLNGNGTYIVQATGLTAGANYYMRVSAAPSPARAVGNYALVADFGGVAAVLQTFAGGTLSQSTPQDNYDLYVSETQLFQFVLSTGTAGMAGDVQVRLEIDDSAGHVVFTLTGRVGDTVSGASVLLTPGQYTVRISAASASGAVVPTISYRLRGASLSDPIGPVSEDPTTEPMYQCPDNPAVYCYCYPDGTYSSTPYDFSKKS